VKTVRQVIAYKKYFLDFYQDQTDEVQRKIEWTLNLLRTIDRVPKKYFDHITGTDGLFEVLVELGGNIFRIFAFFDKENLVVLGNGFQKKSQKTPNTEVEKALKIKAEYENERK
jgi:phage-related protein